MSDLSRKMSYVLRHGGGLDMDPQGWVSFAALAAHLDTTTRQIECIVATNTKQRFEIRDELVRARQGHTLPGIVPVSKDMERKPPRTLYHGTTVEAADLILRDGILAMGRHHAHLSENIETAHVVAARRKASTVVFAVETERMWDAGATFWLTDNDVWLCETVPPAFLRTMQA